MAVWCSSNCIWCINKVTIRHAQLVLGAGKPPFICYQPSTQATQPPVLNRMENKYWSECSDALQVRVTVGMSHYTCRCTCGQTDRHPFNGLFSRTTWVRLHQKGYTKLEFNDAREVGSSMSYKSFAPHSKQITMPASHHSIFWRPPYAIGPLSCLSVCLSVCL